MNNTEEQITTIDTEATVFQNGETTMELEVNRTEGQMTAINSEETDFRDEETETVTGVIINDDSMAGILK